MKNKSALRSEGVYFKYESDLWALRYMLDKACEMITKGTPKNTGDLKNELATEFEELMKVFDEEITKLNARLKKKNITSKIL